MRAHIFLCGLIMFSLLGPGNLLAQNESQPEPFKIPWLFRATENEKYIEEVTHELERRGWRKISQLDNWWELAQDHEIAYVEVEGSNLLKPGRLVPRVGLFLEDTLTKFYRPFRIRTTEQDIIDVKNIFNEGFGPDRKPLIFMHKDDLKGLVPGISRELTDYTSLDWFRVRGDFGLKQQKVGAHFSALESDGWRSVYDLNLPVREWVGKRLAFAQELGRSVAFTHSYLVGGYEFQSEKSLLFGPGPDPVNINLLIQDGQNRPAIYVSPDDVAAIEAANNLEEYFLQQEYSEEAGGEFVVVTDRFGGLPIGLRNDGRPILDEAERHLQRLAHFKPAQIHLLLSEKEIGPDDLNGLKKWFEELKRTSFATQTAADEGFIQLHLENRDEEDVLFQNIALQAKLRGAGDLIVIRQNSALERVILNAMENPVIGENIRSLTLVRGGPDLFRNARALPKGGELHEEDLRRNAFELVLEHLMYPKEEVALSGVERIIYPNGRPLKQGHLIAGVSPVLPTDSKDRLAEILKQSYARLRADARDLLPEHYDDILEALGKVSRDTSGLAAQFDRLLQKNNLQSQNGAIDFLNELDLYSAGIDKPDRYGLWMLALDRLEAADPDLLPIQTKASIFAQHMASRAMVDIEGIMPAEEIREMRRMMKLRAKR